MKFLPEDKQVAFTSKYEEMIESLTYADVLAGRRINGENVPKAENPDVELMNSVSDFIKKFDAMMASIDGV